MFDTILLLAGAAEQSVLPLALRGHNPLLTVIPVGSAAELAALNHFGITPTIQLHGIEFRAVAPSQGLPAT
jgi:hypothetical protein